MVESKYQIIFLDVDGTLCDESGHVPESAKKAIQSAKENGLLIYVCTGRSKPEITQEIIDLGLDGIIGAGGGYIEIAGQVICHKKMSEIAVRKIVAFFNDHNIGYYLESNDGLFGSNNCVASIQKQVAAQYDEGSVEYRDAISEFNWFYDILSESLTKDIDYSNVNKISFISNGYPYDGVYEVFQEELAMYHTTVPQFGPESGEIAVKGVDKKIAIEKVLAKLHLKFEEAIAYGDGNNDIPMFQTVGWKVAMANATPDLKELANEITETAENDGIYKSFLKNSLI